MHSKFITLLLKLPYGPIPTICGAVCAAISLGALYFFGMPVSTAVTVSSLIGVASFFVGLMLDVKFDIWGELIHTFWLREIERAERGWIENRLMLQDALSKFILASSQLACAPGAAGADPTTKQRLKRIEVAIWVVETVLPEVKGWLAFAGRRSLDEWKDVVEQLVDAYTIVQNNGSVLSRWFGLRPAPKEVADEWVRMRKLRIADSRQQQASEEIAAFSSSAPLASLPLGYTDLENRAAVEAIATDEATTSEPQKGRSRR